MRKKRTDSITTEEFDKIFDEGEEDITQYLDLNRVSRPGREAKRINVDFPLWMIAAMDKEAEKIGISRQALIKTVINSHLQSLRQ